MDGARSHGVMVRPDRNAQMQDVQVCTSFFFLFFDPGISWFKLSCKSCFSLSCNLIGFF